MSTSSYASTVNSADARGGWVSDSDMEAAGAEQEKPTTKTTRKHAVYSNGNRRSTASGPGYSLTVEVPHGDRSVSMRYDLGVVVQNGDGSWSVVDESGAVVASAAKRNAACATYGRKLDEAADITETPDKS